MQKTIDTQFTGIYPLSKTLRFELIPQGKTLEFIEQRGLIEQDEERDLAYEIVKKIIDDYHKKFIETALSGASFEWEPLKIAIEQYRKSKTDKTDQIDKTNVVLSEVQDKIREEIADKFKDTVNYDNLLKEKMISELLPEYAKETELTAKQQDAINKFKRFGTYFEGFHSNRKNIYSEKEQSIAIAFRLVHDNFPRFLDNCAIFANMKVNYPSICEDAERELSVLNNGVSLDIVFSADSFNNVLTQSGIEHYNTVIGGIALPNGKKIRGINEFANLYCQQHKEIKRKKLKMTTLYKQILSDRESFSFLPEEFSSDGQVKQSIEEFYSRMHSFARERKLVNIFDEISGLLSKLSENENTRIYVSQSSITGLSHQLFGNWQILHNCLYEQAKVIYGDAQTEANKKRLDKYIKSDEFTLKQINDSLQHLLIYLPEGATMINDICEAWINAAVNVKGIKDSHDKVIEVWQRIKPESQLLRENPDDVEKVKTFLDAIQDYMHLVKPLCANAELDRDNDFYTSFDSLFEQLALIVPLYNKTRNYLSRSTAEGEKYKLNFENPQLANGWDQNKEKDCLSVLFIKDNKYYLGILYAKGKPAFEKVNAKPGESFYQKMVYKLLPGPNKMLPKVFFSAKGRMNFKPPVDIIEGYEQGMHKKGVAFDLVFCHKLIDFFKQKLLIHPDWKIFKFKFSDTSSYQDISGFYREVEEQGYSISFQDIPTIQVDKWVEEGKLYLFQIYNKDFAAGTTGTPNMHTLYWKALFSPENLKDVIFKLNGEAELFYRKASILKPIAHRVGEKMVNRHDNKKNPIPEHSHNELFLYVNNKLSGELSAEGKEYLSCMVVKDVKHEIIKDCRYTKPKFLFHVPLKINFKANARYGAINENVQQYLRQNNDVKIIGIDRGERHLLYLTLINQNGDILEQKSYNTVGDTNYHQMLDQREKERDTARKSWKSVGKIKELKEGYLSQVIHELAEMMVEHNAIVVLEELNFGFKRGRFKIEKQVYQKFEKMLIDKLNYLVFKNEPQDSPGGVLNGYQLTEKFESFQKLGKQSGFLFYVPSAYTSKIDPVTGFVNLFINAALTNREKKCDFISRFTSISFAADEDAFAFSFDYRKFETAFESAKTDWTIYSNGERIVYKKDIKGSEVVYPTRILKELLTKNNIDFSNGNNLLADILSVPMIKENIIFIDTLYRTIMYILQMRNSSTALGVDYIISPVKSTDGTFYDSRTANSCLPKDADANGAFHIALKGLYALRNIKENNKDWVADKIKWLRFAQEKPYKK